MTGPATPFSSPAARAEATDEIGQAGQIGLGQLHEPVAFVGQQVLGELGRSTASRSLTALQPVGGGAVQRGACAQEAAAGQHQHPRLFGVETQAVARVPERLDAARTAAGSWSPRTT